MCYSLRYDDYLAHLQIDQPPAAVPYVHHLRCLAHIPLPLTSPESRNMLTLLVTTVHRTKMARANAPYPSSREWPNLAPRFSPPLSRCYMIILLFVSAVDMGSSNTSNYYISDVLNLTARSRPKHHRSGI